jgi:hypothetical protein
MIDVGCESPLSGGQEILDLDGTIGPATEARLSTNSKEDGWCTFSGIRTSSLISSGD